MEITRATCHYCGGPLPDYGYALDRKDNKQGYILGNVVPCCESCNWIKADRFSYPEMLDLGETIKRIREQRQRALQEDTGLNQVLPAEGD